MIIEDYDDQAATLKKLARQAEAAASSPARAVDADAAELSSRRAPRTIAITSGKGGVGKTLVTVNLAVNFARAGLRVLLIDADLGLANLDVVLGLTPEYTIQDVFDGHKHLSDIALQGPMGITILPAASGVAELSNLSESQRLMLMEQIDHWDVDYDVVLVDTGAGISPNVRYFVLAVEQILVVATPDPASITDAYALMKVMFLNHRIAHFDLLVNQVKGEREALEVYKTVQRVAEKFLNIGLNYAGFVPHDPELVRAIRRQKVVSELLPEAPSSAAFGVIAQRMVRLWEKNPRSEGRMTFFGRRLMTAD
ncbi:MAG: MinD/ParA family protein [Magnetococcales bacterium]|nr:MinD/ParA family protein [Magnetococcales bacterium]